MKSNKIRRHEIKAKRLQRQAKAARELPSIRALRQYAQTYPVDRKALAVDNSYSVPEFVLRGYYIDQEFICRDCGIHQLWKASQQKWWYEACQASVWTIASRCRNCRREERERRERARAIHRAGILKRQSQQYVRRARSFKTRAEK